MNLVKWFLFHFILFTLLLTRISCAFAMTPSHPHHPHHPHYDEKTLNEVIQLLQKESPVKFSEDEIYQAAISGILSRVDQKLSLKKDASSSSEQSPEQPPVGFFNFNQFNTLLDAETIKDVQEETKGEIAGIGIVIHNPPPGLGLPIIRELIKEGSAEKSGLKRNDLLVKVDGKSTTQMSFPEIVGKIRGPIKTTVALTILRDGQIIEKKIPRVPITVASVKVIKVDPQTKVISINLFGEKTPQELKQALTHLSSQKIIFDLRQCRGGLFDSMIQSLELLIPKGKVLVKLLKASDNVEEIKSKGDPLNSLLSESQAKIVILTSRGTTSAAEAFASALRHHLGAKIIGDYTFGKGSIEKVMELKNGGGNLKITVAKMLDQQNRSWIGQGIKPDLLIPSSPDREKEKEKKMAIGESDEAELIDLIPVARQL